MGSADELPPAVETPDAPGLDGPGEGHDEGDSIEAPRRRRVLSQKQLDALQLGRDIKLKRMEERKAARKKPEQEPEPEPEPAEAESQASDFKILYRSAESEAKKAKAAAARKARQAEREKEKATAVHGAVVIREPGFIIF